MKLKLLQAYLILYQANLDIVRREIEQLTPKRSTDWAVVGFALLPILGCGMISILSMIFNKA